MYRQVNQWEDALRVAKTYGGINASKQVAYAWALTLGKSLSAHVSLGGINRETYTPEARDAKRTCAYLRKRIHELVAESRYELLSNRSRPPAAKQSLTCAPNWHNG